MTTNTPSDTLRLDVNDKTTTPIWSDTRTERTEERLLLSPTSSEESFRIRTVTTTERVQIVQLPVIIAEGDDRRTAAELAAEVLALSGEEQQATTRTVCSTTTLFDHDREPIVGAICANGLPLIVGIAMQPCGKQTTTIVTTTTTTYKILEADDIQELMSPTQSTTLSFEDGNIDNQLVEQLMNLPIGEVDTSSQIDNNIVMMPVYEMRKYEDSLQPSNNKKATDAIYVVISKRESDNNEYEDNLSPVSIRITDDNISPYKNIEQTWEIYDPDDIDNTVCHNLYPSTSQGLELQTQLLKDYVSVYHNKPSEPYQHLQPAQTHRSKLGSLFKKTDKYAEYPTSVSYDGQLENTIRSEDMDSSPLQQHVSVYHSGRSDSAQVDNVADDAVKLKATGLLKKDDNYPSTSSYEGPVELTNKTTDLNHEPLHEQVAVYHSGRSDEGGRGIGGLVSDLFKRKDKKKEVEPEEIVVEAPQIHETVARSDYPATFAYDGTIEEMSRNDDVPNEPINNFVQVYHSGKSDQSDSKLLDSFKDKAEDVGEAFTDVAQSLSSKLGSLFKKTDKYAEYPTSVSYDGQLENTIRSEDMDSSPLQQHVSVYHSGRSDSAQVDNVADDAVKLKATGLLKKDDNYPSTSSYEGPVELTNKTTDLNHEPLHEQVAVYHSGRSDEGGRGIGGLVSDLFKRKDKKKEVEPEEIVVEAPQIHETVARSDYPATFAYDGTIEEMSRNDDVPNEPINNFVQVYHSGKSDQSDSKLLDSFKDKAEDVGEAFTDVAQSLSSKLGSLFKKTDKYAEYPTSVSYDGQLENTIRSEDMDSSPLQQHVSVYHSGRSDSAQVDNVADDAVKLKATGLLKKDDNYPSTSSYEGPVELTNKTTDLNHEPLHEQVAVYHSGRSDEGGRGIGGLVSDLFKRKDKKKEVEPEEIVVEAPQIHETVARSDYPATFAYDGTIEEMSRNDDVPNEPINNFVQVYHSGKSDQSDSKLLDSFKDKAEDVGEAFTDVAQSLSSKLGSLFKKTDKYAEYPTSVSYDGQLENTIRSEDMDSSPLQQHVSVYHSGRSDSAQVDNVADDAVKLKATGLLKKDDNYPSTSSYEGPVELTNKTTDLNHEPLHEQVAVYHSGRSDEGGRGIGGLVSDLFKRKDKKKEVEPEEIVVEAPQIHETVARSDYPATFAYDGTIEEMSRNDDVPNEPINNFVQVYHSGKSDQSDSKLLDSFKDKAEDVGEAFTDVAQSLSSKLGSLFKKTDKYAEYPTSVSYDGQLENTIRSEDMDSSPLQQHVSVYHSGRSDSAQVDNVADDAVKLKATGLLKKDDNYPSTSSYEGPVELTNKTTDLNHEPLHEQVAVYHSGRSDEGGRGIGGLVSDLFKRKDKKKEVEPEEIVVEAPQIHETVARSDYPATFAYDGTIEEMSRNDDVPNEPINNFVQVYHSGKSDQSDSKLLDSFKDKAEDVGEAFTDVAQSLSSKLGSLFKKTDKYAEYPTSVSYDGQLENTIRSEDMDSSPLQQHVSVYHSGRSDSAQVDNVADDAVKLKATGLLKKDDNYPSTSSYEGPVELTNKTTDLNHEPLHEQVAVYHSGRSDEGGRGIGGLVSDLFKRKDKKKEVEPEEIVVEAPQIHETVARSDYPATFAYDGTIEEMSRNDDVPNEPINNFVQVYHSGKSDQSDSKLLDSFKDKAEDVGEAFTDVAQSLSSKLGSLFKKTDKYAEYPTSVSYDGQLENTIRSEDMDSSPLQQHVSVYHSGRSDSAQVDNVADDAVKLKATGLLKKDDNYPSTSSYEGPVELTNKTTDLNHEPLHEQVAVYHSGRSDEGGRGIGGLVSDLFKRKDKKKEVEPEEIVVEAPQIHETVARSDYPATFAYDGTIEEMSRNDDVPNEPINNFVQVYHSGKSDQSDSKLLDSFKDKAEDVGEAFTDVAQSLSSKLGSLFKKTDKYAEYPTSVSYDGQLENTIRSEDMDSSPLQQHVSVYHSGRSDSAQVDNVADDAVKLKATGLLKKDDNYPSTSSYEGPVELTNKTTDLNHEPLHEQVAVYHSGRSDEGGRGIGGLVSDLFKRKDKKKEVEPEEIVVEAPQIHETVARSDYPATFAYDGTIEEMSRNDDVPNEPINNFVQVYHSGKSDQSDSKLLDSFKDKAEDVGEAFTDVAQSLSSKLGSLFKKTDKYAEYPTSVSYDGQLENTIRSEDMDSSPLQQHVSVYHSGRSDSAQVDNVADDAVKLKATGLLKKDDNYPSTSSYEGPVELTNKTTDLNHEPLHEQVAVYHSGRSDEGGRGIGGLVSDLFKRKDKKKEVEPEEIVVEAPQIHETVARSDYPATFAYDGTIEEMSRNDDVPNEPINNFVQVYHSGKSDQSDSKLLDSFKDKAEDVGEAFTDVAQSLSSKLGSLFKKTDKYAEYPTSVSYDGQLENTIRSEDMDSSPLQQHVSVYHSGRSDSAQVDNVADDAVKLKATGLLKKDDNYPSTSSYEGPVELTNKTTDLNHEPLHEQVAVYHSGRSDEGGRGIGGLVSDLFKRKDKKKEVEPEEIVVEAPQIHETVARSDYPATFAYDGTIEEMSRNDDVPNEPINNFVQVYHSGKSDQSDSKLLDSFKDKAEDVGEAFTDVAQSLSSKLGSLFKKTDKYAEYPTSVSYDGQLENTIRSEDMDSSPLQQHVSVYHSGRSDSAQVDNVADDAVKLKATGLLKKDDNYPSTSSYEGPVELTNKTTDLNHEPLHEQVAVYHSGRSDEGGRGIGGLVSDLFKRKDKKKEVEPEEIVVEAPQIHETVARSDYPATFAYDGTIEEMSRNDDVPNEPINNFVQVYHSGKSDQSDSKLLDSFKDKAEDVGEAFTDVAQSLSSKLGSLFKKTDKYAEYPTSVSYDGQLENTIRSEDMDSSPLQQHVSVYHSGRSDSAQVDNVADDAVKLKATGLLKKDDNYPSTSSYEGPVELTNKTTDLNHEPLHEQVAVYHSGRSDEGGRGIGGLVSDLFKRKDKKKEVEPEEIVVEAPQIHETVARSDYPATFAYDGTIEEMSRNDDVPNEPINNFVQVYHSGKSDQSDSKLLDSFKDKAEDVGEAFTDVAQSLSSKLGSLFKKTDKYAEYPTSVSYDGQLENTIRSEDMDSSPLQQHVSVYHSGRSDSAQVDNVADDAVKLKATGLLKKDDNYPSTSSYEGPVELTNKTTDLNHEPLHEQVAVYHSGRSDEGGRGIGGLVSDLFKRKDKKKEVEPEEIVVEAPQIHETVARSDYPATFAYDGTIEEMSRNDDVPNEPINNFVQVYHSGKSDQSDSKLLDSFKDKAEDVGEAFTDVAQSLSSKLGSLFKKTDKYAEYPTSVSYDGQLENTIRSEDMDSSPLQQHVSVYHSGRSDSAQVDNVADDAVKLKATGLLKKDDNYPSTSSYEGPVELTNKTTDLNHEPLHEQVAVYHSGRSDEGGRGIGGLVSDLFKRKDKKKEVEPEEIVVEAPQIHETVARSDYPATFAYDGTIEEMSRNDDVPNEPINNFVQVYHSGKSDQSDSKLLDSFKDKAEDVGEAFTDVAQSLSSKLGSLFKKTDKYAEYPTSVSYDGQLENTIRSEDMDSSPLQQHVSVYHSGRSDSAQVDNVADDAVKLKATGLLKKDDNYPSTSSYEGPVELTNKTTDLNHEPLHEQVAVYHSGRSDEGGRGIGGLVSDLFKRKDKKKEVEPEEIVVEAPQILQLERAVRHGNQEARLLRNGAQETTNILMVVSTGKDELHSTQVRNVDNESSGIGKRMVNIFKRKEEKAQKKKNITAAFVEMSLTDDDQDSNDFTFGEKYVTVYEGTHDNLALRTSEKDFDYWRPQSVEQLDGTIQSTNSELHGWTRFDIDRPNIDERMQNTPSTPSSTVEITEFAAMDLVNIRQANFEDRPAQLLIAIAPPPQIPPRRKTHKQADNGTYSSSFNASSPPPLPTTPLPPASASYDDDARLVYKTSGLQEIAVPAKWHNDPHIPMIEEDAIECTIPTVRPIKTSSLVAGQYVGTTGSNEQQSGVDTHHVHPIRNARQRFRHYCTML